MPTRRIHFKNNPWPEGHPINDFAWTARVEDGQVWFDLHLVTFDYYAERSIEEEDPGDESSWRSPSVWANYHYCTLSPTRWGEVGGFLACPLSEYSAERIDGVEFQVDEPPPEDTEDNAFHIYLLGHDAAASHRIRFMRRAGTDRFDIHWSGRIALAYIGHYDYEHAFEACIEDVAFPVPQPAR